MPLASTHALIMDVLRAAEDKSLAHLTGRAEVALLAWNGCFGAHGLRAALLQLADADRNASLLHPPGLTTHRFPKRLRRARKREARHALLTRMRTWACSARRGARTRAKSPPHDTNVASPSL